MPQLTLTGQPVPIKSPNALPINGQNTSVETIYLSSLPDVSSTNFAAAIEPGGSFTWPGEGVLYVCTGAGLTAIITYTTNGAVINSGASSVSLITDTDTLLNYTAPLPLNAATLVLDTTNLSRYQGIAITCGDAFSASVGATTAVARIRLTWLTLSGQPITYQAPVYYANGILNYTVPVMGPRLQVYVETYGTGSTALPIIITGTAQRLERTYYQEPALIGREVNLALADASTTPLAKMMAYAFTLTGAPGTIFLPSWAGPCSFMSWQIVIAAPNNVVQILALDQTAGINGHSLYVEASAAAIVNKPIPLIFPEKPIRLTLQRNTSQMALSFAWQ